MRITKRSSIGPALAVVLTLLGGACSSTKSANSGSTGSTTAPTLATTGSTAGAGQTIKIGGIFNRTGSTNPAVGGYEAASAFFQNVNAQGGVDGYKFSFTGLDDAGDPSKFQADVQQLLSSGVDAIITPASIEEPGGQALILSSGIPYIGAGGYDRAMFEAPNVFPTTPSIQGADTKAIETLIEAAQPAVTNVTITPVNYPSVVSILDTMKSDLTTAGVHATMTPAFPLTATDFTSTAAEILNTHTKNAVFFALDYQSSPFVAALQQQGYTGLIYSGSYNTKLPAQMGSYANNRYITAQSYGVLGAGQAGSNAESIVKQYYPSTDLVSDSAAMDSWTDGELLVGAIKAIGSNPVSKQSIIAALDTLSNFQTTFMPPLTYTSAAGGHLDPSHCSQTLEVKNVQWALATSQRFTCWQGSVAPSS